MSRKIQKIHGVQTYFFPKLLLFAAENHHYDWENANPIFSFIFESSIEKPSEEDLLEFFIHQNSQFNVSIHSIILDSILLSGNIDFKKKCKWVNFNSRRELQKVARNAKLHKDFNSKIYSFVLKLILAGANIFTTICELCDYDLDFDAYVIIKLLGLETKWNSGDVKVILNNILDTVTNEDLKNYICFGSENNMDRLLKEPMDKRIMNVLVKRILKNSMENNLMSTSRCHFQLFFLMVRCMVSSDHLQIGKILTMIPEDVRNEMLPGLQMNTFKTAILLANQCIQMVLERKTSSLSFVINDDFSCCWRRLSILKTLENFKVAVVEKCFEEEALLIPTENVAKNQTATVKVKKALQFAMWIVEFFGVETSDEALQNLFFLDRPMTVQMEKSLFADGHIHAERLLKALDKSKVPIVRYVREDIWNLNPLLSGSCTHLTSSESFWSRFDDVVDDSKRSPRSPDSLQFFFSSSEEEEDTNFDFGQGDFRRRKIRHKKMWQ